MEVQARKFYSQRNMYLCGFTLFLSLILNRTYTLILEVLRLEEKVKAYQGESTGSEKSSKKLSEAGGVGEIGSLRKKLAEKDRDLETLKKQAAGLSREYNELADKYNASNPGDKTPRKDM
jgi:B-cell receptor-associated protein 31